ncbi:hypothetical protein IFR04_010486 [Cadophora malorum]|uniref:Uncharacterized protein n=1 Tax=Cadophora malorum TaxID=108018 RepID=A0A8H7TB35_9HELO|nr:hypothetical protein IFR04_010486 [Cadophora malorum]
MPSAITTSTTTYTQNTHSSKLPWSDVMSKPRDAWGLPTTAAATPANIESPSATSKPSQPSQTSWEIQDPELDAQSRKLFGLAPTNIIPAERGSSLDWCMKRKKEILELQSSKRFTKVFALAIIATDTSSTACRWCQADGDEFYDRNQWEVHHHIHCNKPGKKVCKAWCSLTPPGVKDNCHRAEKPAVSRGDKGEVVRTVAW